MRKSRFIEHLGPDEPPLPSFGITCSSSMSAISSNTQSSPSGFEFLPNHDSYFSLTSAVTMSSIISQAPLLLQSKSIVPATFERERVFHDALLSLAREHEAAFPSAATQRRRRHPRDVYASSKSSSTHKWTPRLENTRDVVFWIASVCAIGGFLIMIAMIPTYVVAETDEHLFTLVLAVILLLVCLFIMLVCSDSFKSAWLRSIGMREVGELDSAIREQRAKRRRQGGGKFEMVTFSYESGRKTSGIRGGGDSGIV